MSLVSSLVPEAPEAEEETPQFNVKQNGLVSFSDAAHSDRSSSSFLPEIKGKHMSMDRKRGQQRQSEEDFELEDIICGEETIDDKILEINCPADIVSKPVTPKPRKSGQLLDYLSPDNAS